jgi:hypothetical protein
LNGDYGDNDILWGRVLVKTLKIIIWVILKMVNVIVIVLIRWLRLKVGIEVIKLCLWFRVILEWLDINIIIGEWWRFFVLQKIPIVRIIAAKLGVV